MFRICFQFFYKKKGLRPFFFFDVYSVYLIYASTNSAAAIEVAIARSSW